MISYIALVWRAGIPKGWQALGNLFRIRLPSRNLLKINLSLSRLRNSAIQFLFLFLLKILMSFQPILLTNRSLMSSLPSECTSWNACSPRRILFNFLRLAILVTRPIIRELSVSKALGWSQVQKYPPAKIVLVKSSRRLLFDADSRNDVIFTRTKHPRSYIF